LIFPDVSIDQISMAFFKFRKSADEPTNAAPAQESVESMRRRAKYRLLGATVLIVLGVVVFPLLFDKQPRPIAVDTPIDIPDRNKVVPLVLPPAASSRPVMPKAPASARASAPAATQPASATAPVPNVEVKPTKKEVPEPGTETVLTKPEVPASAAPPKLTASTPAKVPQPAPVKAAPDIKASDIKQAEPVVSTAGRYILQVGAFADAAHAQEVRLKLEHAGLKTYTQVADTPDGKRIRVRVGPFTAKAEAEKVAVKIKKLNLPAALLLL
jgi:DedD protein